MSEGEFVRLSAPGGVLMTAEECGTGLAGCILHAAHFHGQETAVVAGLELLGLGGGVPSTATAAPATAPEPMERQDVAASVGALIAGLRKELDGLGMSQRQWYKRTLKQRSGLSLEEWEAVSKIIKDDPAHASRYAADLKRVADYFAKLETDARGYIRDAKKLDEAIAALEERRAIAERAAAGLG